MNFHHVLPTLACCWGSFSITISRVLCGSCANLPPSRQLTEPTCRGSRRSRRPPCSAQIAKSENLACPASIQVRIR